MTRQRVNTNNYLHLDNYIKLLNEQNSVLIEDVKSKILGKPNKFKGRGVLVKDESELELNQDQLMHRRMMNIPKRAILQAAGGKSKTIKRVTFAYIPAYKEEGGKKEAIQND